MNIIIIVIKNKHNYLSVVLDEYIIIKNNF